MYDDVNYLKWLYFKAKLVAGENWVAQMCKGES